MKKQFKTWLPVFTGFYETIFSPDEETEIYAVNNEREDKGLTPLDDNVFEFDYETYNNNVIISACDFIERELNSLGFECSITNPELRSPKYYNYSNDSINIDIELDYDKLLKYLNHNFTSFRAYIKKRYTSCSGFISYYSNDANVWLTKEIEKNPDHCIGAVLDFVLHNELSNPEEDMYYSISDNYLSCTNYEELIKQTP